MKKPKNLPWKICCTLVIFLSILTFTPIVIPQGKITPVLFGFPYSFWMGIIVTLCFVLLTYIGSRIHPGNKEGEES